MKALKAIVVLLCLLTTIAAVHAAETINVSVDGALVQFQGVGAQSVNGRVLVPLRGVLERLGAFVGWDAATRTVIAQRGDKDVSLPIGSKTARINGKDVALDVPAVVMSGTTMVPLRFVGEALGADVKWNAATKAVEIKSAAGSTSDVPATTTGPAINSFTHDASDWLIAADKLKVTMQGTPGGTANFEIPGVTGATAMKEVSPGKYEATWTVPANAHSVAGASVIGKLVSAGQSLLIQAAKPVSIDVTPPTVQDLAPLPDSSIAQPKPGISATFGDGSGSGIDTGSVKLLVNDKDVTADANVTQSFVSYRPNEALKTGPVNINLTVRDTARNSVTKTWKFTVKEASQVIKSVTYNAPAELTPGDVIAVRMEGQAGGKGSFWFAAADGSKLRQGAMQESPAGVYTAEYTVRRDESLTGCSVVGSLSTSAGETFTLTADEKIGGTAAPVGAPQITSPTEGASVASPVKVTGKAAAGASVRLTVTYDATVLGALSLTGAVDDQTVTANDQGVFESKPMDLGTLVGGKDTVYTLSAKVVGTDGTESQPAVVKFKKK